MTTESDRVDRRFKYAMLVVGILAAVLFIFSLVAMIEFPSAFRIIAYGMVGLAILFFLLRTVYHFRITFRVKEKRKSPKKG
jgi:inner membrane protein involved in colicin E2 resistance